jgi:hypothetical protein
MNSFISITAQQLRAAADLKERIQSLERQLAQILGGGVTVAAVPARRRLSPSAIANIRAGVRKRMAALKAQGSAKAGGRRPKRKLSPAARAAIAATARARWAKAKAAGRNRL